MKSLYRHLIAAGLVAAIGLGAIAQAQTPPAGGTGGRPDAAQMEQFRARMQERMAKRLGELKQKLQITGAQEAAWGSWTATLQPQPRQRMDRAEFEKLTTPERIDRLRAVRAERNAEMDKRMDATKNFYAVLSAERKKVFDAESMRFLRGGKRGFGGHGHGHHHQRS
jgi:periplasmic protein CpxP/Spy